MRIADLPAAPGEEGHLSIALANSGGWEMTDESVDLLGGPRHTSNWMIARGLAEPDADVREYCSERLKTFRSDVRAVLQAATTAGRPPTAALGAVNDAMKLAPVVHLLAWDQAVGFTARAEHPATRAVEHAMSAIAADVLNLLAGPDATLLACCDAPPCGRYLLRTHPRRRWCFTRCGDRFRAARAYTRKTQAAKQL